MNDLSKLRSLTELKYQSGQAKLQKLLEEEARLRSDIERIRGHTSEAIRSGSGGMGAIGADVAWFACAEKMKAELNIELARVLAKKEQHLTKAKKEYARVLVTRKLETNEAEQRFKSQTSKVLRNAIEVDLQRRLSRER